MPKDTSKDSYSPGTRPSTTRDGGPLNVLKRNQACHQCRKRKLKCDAKRPCSTCIRSHAHAVAHAPAGTHIPPNPDCTFDDAAENPAIVPEGPKNRYEKLENRINELETLLRQKELGSEQDADSPPLFERSTSGLSQPDINNPNGDPNFILPQGHPTQFSARPFSSPNSGGTSVLEGQFSQASLVDQSFSHISEVRSPMEEDNASPQPGLEMSWPSWPPNVPRPDLLRHLVELFFAFQPHATRLFHVPSFMASLSLPPTHPRFPISPILHAICAVSTLYTAAVSSPPLPNYSEVIPNEIFQQKHRVKDRRPDSFAEEQARYTRETIDKYLFTGENLVQVLQANVILSWYFWCHARWVEVFIGSGHSMRMLVPLGLNMCPPFHSISKALRGASILAPARTVIEDETRRNVFWLAYATDRTASFGNGWAHAIDDEDVAQLLPVRNDQFNKGDLVAPHERQWAHSKNVSLVHPEEQTDSFTLYIKGAILISRVKNFNLRFRSRHYAGDPACSVGPSLSSEPVDPRTTQAFKDLDNVVLSFRSSFPAQFKSPVNGNVVDPHLYCASLYPLVCTILLHDPHADVRKSGCISALKILTAARATLDLIYAVWSTSYDITLMDLSCTFCWLMAGRVLVRFLSAAQEANSQDQIATLRTELEFVQLAISKVGERVPLAYMHAKLLHDSTVDAFGPAFNLSSSGSLSPTPMESPSNLQTFGSSPVPNNVPILSW